MEIRETYRRASLQREASLGLKGDDWAAYRSIQETHEKLRANEVRSYHAEYQTRVEATQKRLIDQAASRGRPLMPRFVGADRFDKAEINRAAHRYVKQDHRQLLEKMELTKRNEIDALLQSVARRGELAGKLRDEFSVAGDRRVGPDRRQGPSR